MASPPQRRMRAIGAHLLAGAAQPPHGRGRSPSPAFAAGGGGVACGILTEATGDHLGGFLNGFATADGVGSVSVADITEGAQFDAVRKAIPPERLGGFYLEPAAMLAERAPALTLVTAEAHRSAPLVRAALESGSHVLLEKPGCANLAEFEELCDLADEKGLTLMLAMATRANPAVVKAKELIDAGYLGVPYSATMDWIADQTRLTREAHLYPPEQGGDLSWCAPLTVCPASSRLRPLLASRDRAHIMQEIRPRQVARGQADLPRHALHRRAAVAGRRHDRLHGRPHQQRRGLRHSERGRGRRQLP